MVYLLIPSLFVRHLRVATYIRGNGNSKTCVDSTQSNQAPPPNQLINKKIVRLVTTQMDVGRQTLTLGTTPQTNHHEKKTVRGMS